LIALSTRDELRGPFGATVVAPLRRFAGVPEPWPAGIVLARGAGLLVPAEGGAELTPVALKAGLKLVSAGPHRVWVLSAPDAIPALNVGGESVTLAESSVRGVFWGNFTPRPAERLAAVESSVPASVWLVPHAEEIPPPPPEPFKPEDGQNSSQDPVDGGVESPPR